MRHWLPIWFAFWTIIGIGKHVHANEGRDPLSTMVAVSFGSVEDAGYGAKGTLGAGWHFDEIFSLEIQGGMGITEEINLGPERFYHLEVLVPATMTICSSKSWVCPGSTFEIVAISGVGGARFTGRWAPTVVAGIALDSFLFFDPVDVGIRAGFVGHYDVLEYERLVVMLQLNLGVIFRFGKRGS
ncbi:MAG: hypothetical protein QNJ97_21665 [Myxococcota bacterium]|nr:hypothetical protein [Myxococcota bacterium]